MTNTTLEKEFSYFLKNREELLKKYPNQYIVIVGEGVVGVFPNEKEAFEDSVGKYGLGKFIIQLCDKNEGKHIQTFHSRVSFA